MMTIDLIAQLKGTREFFASYSPKDVNTLFDGKSLLFYSISNSDLDSRYTITNFLLNEGAQVTGVDDENNTLLHILLSRTNHDLPKTIELCKRLIEKGVDINIVDRRNRLALQYLVMMHYTDDELKPLYELWFSQPKVLVNVKNAWGKSPLDLAELFSYRKELVEMMRKYGV